MFTVYCCLLREFFTYIVGPSVRNFSLRIFANSQTFSPTRKFQAIRQHVSVPVQLLSLRGRAKVIVNRLQLTVAADPEGSTTQSLR